MKRLIRRSVASDGTACSGQMSGCFLALTPNSRLNCSPFCEATSERRACAFATLAKADWLAVDEQSRSVWLRRMKRSVTGAAADWESAAQNCRETGKVGLRLIANQGLSKESDYAPDDSEPVNWTRRICDANSWICRSLRGLGLRRLVKGCVRP